MTNLTMRDDLYVEGLEALCRAWLRPNFVAAEIGVFAGEGSAVLARHVAKLICVDPWDNRYTNEILEGCENEGLVQAISDASVDIEAAEQEFDRVMAQSGNIVKVKATDDAVIGLIGDGVLDAIYIDAAHTYEAVRIQIESWRRTVRPGGVIAGHDYSPDWPGVVAAVNEAFGEPHEVFSDTSWVVRQATASEKR